MTVDVASTLLPDESVAVNRTVVVPTGNSGGASCVIAGAGSTTSVAVAPERNAAISGDVAGTGFVPVVDTVIAAGTVSVGSPVSWTTTWKLPPTVSSGSPAVQLTVVVPSGKRAVTVSVPFALVPPGPSHATSTG